MTPWPRQRASLVAFVLLIFMASACKTVPASQRGTLLEPCMQPPSDPMEIALDSHVHESREAIVGGTAVGGPSCGCN